MRTKWVTMTMIAALAMADATAKAADCEQGRALYEQAMRAGQADDMAQAATLLEQSTALCEAFESWYLLGQAYQSLQRAAEAGQAFERAQALAANRDAGALALGRYAETRAQQGDAVEALQAIQEARSLHSNPPAWMNELALRLDEESADRPLELAQVTRALTLPSRAFQIVDKPPAAGGAQPAAPANPNAGKPSINVRINFQYNSEALEADSAGNIRVLADALAQNVFSGKSFRLIGHTDVRGTPAYNQALSERRARAVAEQLATLSPALAGRLRTEGAGESRPLYPGAGEREHRLNRRLEVVVD